MHFETEVNGRMLVVVFNPLCPVRFSYCYIVFTFAFLFRIKLSVSASVSERIRFWGQKVKVKGHGGNSTKRSERTVLESRVPSLSRFGVRQKS